MSGKVPMIYPPQLCSNNVQHIVQFAHIQRNPTIGNVRIVTDLSYVLVRGHNLKPLP